MSCRSFVAIAALLIPITGCDRGPGDQPDLGQVSGTVKLDGNPLPDATIEFQPDGGRPSTGKTNDEGEYELQYTGSTMGAKVGEHQVRISTLEQGELADGSDGVIQPERVPDVYNTTTTLRRTVEPGSQEIDFDLDSKEGKISQPSEGSDNGATPSC